MMFMIQFLIFVCVVAVVIIGIRWLLSLTGVSIPQPLMLILGILLFIFLLIMFLQYIGYGTNLGLPVWHH
jgi:hypothetical protein